MLRTVMISALCTALATAWCGYTTHAGVRVDLTSVPTSTMQIDQVFEGMTDPYTWVINPCEAYSLPPSGVPACDDGAAFISQYSNSHCDDTWIAPIAPWQYDLTTGTGAATFTNSRDWLATIYISCGTTPNLTSAGPVRVSTALHFSFWLTTSYACGTAAPTPNPTSVPTTVAPTTSTFAPTTVTDVPTTVTEAPTTVTDSPTSDTDTPTTTNVPSSVTTGSVPAPTWIPHAAPTNDPTTSAPSLGRNPPKKKDRTTVIAVVVGIVVVSAVVAIIVFVRNKASRRMPTGAQDDDYHAYVAMNTGNLQ